MSTGKICHREKQPHQVAINVLSNWETSLCYVQLRITCRYQDTNKYLDSIFGGEKAFIFSTTWQDSLYKMHYVAEHGHGEYPLARIRDRYSKLKHCYSSNLNVCKTNFFILKVWYLLTVICGEEVRSSDGSHQRCSWQICFRWYYPAWISEAWLL